jgi:hypothetical protein
MQEATKKITNERINDNEKYEKEIKKIQLDIMSLQND